MPAVVLPFRPAAPPSDDEGTMRLIAGRVRDRHPDLPEVECLRRANFAMAEARGGAFVSQALDAADINASFIDGPEDPPAGIAVLIAGAMAPRRAVEAPVDDAPVCRSCQGAGDLPSGEVDEDGDEVPPVLCPACAGTGKARLAAVKTSEARTARDGEGRLNARATPGPDPVTRPGQQTPPSSRSRPAEAPRSRAPSGVSPEVRALDALVLAELARRVVAQAYDLALVDGMPGGPADVLESLSRLLKRGLVEKHGRGRVLVWRVVRAKVSGGPS